MWSFCPAEAPGFCEWLTFCAGIACNASWVVVATCANAFTVAGTFGWKDNARPHGIHAASERIVRTDCVAFQHDDVALTLTHVHAHTHTLIRQAFRPCRKSKYSDANLVLRGVLTKQTGCGRTNLESLALHLLLLSWLWLWPSLAFSWVFYEVIW